MNKLALIQKISSFFFFKRDLSVCRLTEKDLSLNILVSFKTKLFMILVILSDVSSNNSIDFDRITPDTKMMPKNSRVRVGRIDF